MLGKLTRVKCHNSDLKSQKAMFSELADLHHQDIPNFPIIPTLSHRNISSSGGGHNSTNFDSCETSNISFCLL